jgi:hypothetical protein
MAPGPVGPERHRRCWCGGQPFPQLSAEAVGRTERDREQLFAQLLERFDYLLLATAAVANSVSTVGKVGFAAGRVLFIGHRASARPDAAHCHPLSPSQPPNGSRMAQRPLTRRVTPSLRRCL